MRTGEHRVFGPLHWKSLQRLRAALRCPICDDMMRAALLIRACGHTYCSLCIRTALDHKPECPMCRVTGITSADLLPNRLVDSVLKAFDPIENLLQSHESSQQEQQSIGGASPVSDVIVLTTPMREHGRASPTSSPLLHPTPPPRPAYKRKPVYGSWTAQRARQEVRKLGFPTQRGMSKAALIARHRAFVNAYNAAIDASDGNVEHMDPASVVDLVLREEKARLCQDSVGAMFAPGGEVSTAEPVAALYARLIRSNEKGMALMRKRQRQLCRESRSKLTAVSCGANVGEVGVGAHSPIFVSDGPPTGGTLVSHGDRSVDEDDAVGAVLVCASPQDAAVPREPQPPASVPGAPRSDPIGNDRTAALDLDPGDPRPTAPDPSSLPSGWRCIWSDTCQAPFYFHVGSRTGQWTAPMKPEAALRESGAQSVASHGTNARSSHGCQYHTPGGDEATQPQQEQLLCSQQRQAAAAGGLASPVTPRHVSVAAMEATGAHHPPQQQPSSSPPALSLPSKATQRLHSARRSVSKRSRSRSGKCPDPTHVSSSSSTRRSRDMEALCDLGDAVVRKRERRRHGSPTATTTTEKPTPRAVRATRVHVSSTPAVDTPKRRPIRVQRPRRKQ